MLFAGCNEKADNSFDQIEYQCGSVESPNTALLLVPHSPGGESLKASEFEAFYLLDGALTPAIVTSKGCVLNRFGNTEITSGDVVIFTGNSAGIWRTPQLSPVNPAAIFHVNLAPLTMDRSKWLACGFFPAVDIVNNSWAILNPISNPQTPGIPDDLRVAWDLDGKNHKYSRSENGCIAVPADVGGFISMISASGNTAARKFISNQDIGVYQEVELLPVANAERFLECGIFSNETLLGNGDVESTVKLLAPDGQELSDVSRLSVRYGQGAHTLSERGCLYLAPDTTGPVTVRYDLGTSFWGIPDLKKAASRHVALVAYNQGDITASCESVIATNTTTINLPVKADFGTALEIYVVNMELLDHTKKVVVKNSWAAEKKPDLSFGIESLADGHYNLLVSIENLLKSGSALSRPVLTSCEVVIDRKTPGISAVLTGVRSLGDTNGLTLFQPGQAISFQKDTSGGSTVFSEFCFIKESDAGEALSECAWQEFSEQISAPESGRWRVRFRARDLAGNLSEAKEVPFLVYHEAEIEVIRTILSEVKSSLVNGRHIYAMEQALRAESRRRKLPTKIEQDLLATGTKEALINSGAELYQLNYVTLPNTVNSVAFHPDSLRFLSAGGLGEINLHDISGRDLGLVAKTDRQIFSIAFDSSGSRIAATNDTGYLYLFSFPDGVELGRVKTGGSTGTEVKFTPDGKSLLVTHRSKEVVVVDVETLGIKQVFSGHSNEIWAVTLAPDQKTVISGDKSGVVRFWNIETGIEIRNFQAGNNIDALNISADGKYLYVGANGLSKWSLEDIDALPEYLGNYSVADLKVSSDDDTVYVGQSSGCINVIRKVGDAGQLTTCVNIYPDGRPWSVGLSADNKILITAGYDNKVRIWDAKSRYNRFSHHGGSIKDIVVTKDFSTVLSVGDPGHVGLIDLNNGTANYFQISSRTINGIDLIGFPDQSMLFTTAGDDGMAYLFNTNPQATAPMIPFGDGSVAFSATKILPKNETVAFGDVDGGIRFVSFEGVELPPISAHMGRVEFLQITDDENTIVSGGEDHNINFWKIDDRSLIRTLTGHFKPVSSMSFHSSKPLAASTSQSGHVIIWNTTDWSKNTEWLAHNSCLTSAVFHPVEDIIMTTSCDTTVRHWSLKGELLATYDAHTCGVRRGAFNSTGNLMLTGSCDGSIRIWDLDVGNQVKSGCSWLNGYLENNQDADPEVKRFCQGIR